MLSMLEEKLLSTFKALNKRTELEFQLLNATVARLQTELEKSRLQEQESRDTLIQQVDNLLSRIAVLESSLAQFSKRFHR